MAWDFAVQHHFIMLIFCVNSGLLSFGHTHTVLLQKLFIKAVTFHFRTHLEIILLFWWCFDLGNRV